MAAHFRNVSASSRALSNTYKRHRTRTKFARPPRPPASRTKQNYPNLPNVWRRAAPSDNITIWPFRFDIIQSDTLAGIDSIKSFISQPNWFFKHCSNIKLSLLSQISDGDINIFEQLSKTLYFLHDSSPL